MNMMFRKRTVDKVFTEAVKAIQEILTAFGGDILYGKTVGKDNQQPASAPQGTEAQRHQFIGWFTSIFMGLSAEDEAAFLEALTCLKPAQWVKIGARLKALGDSNKADTPEARAFRKAVVTMTDFKARVEVLQMAAELPEADWLILADTSGAAVAGQMDKAWCLVRAFGPKILAAAKAFDQKLAQAIENWNPTGTKAFDQIQRIAQALKNWNLTRANPTDQEIAQVIHSWDSNLGRYTSELNQWRIDQKEALKRRREKPRSPWRRLGEFFGILRPLPLNPGTHRGLLHQIKKALGVVSSHSSSRVRSAGNQSAGTTAAPPDPKPAPAPAPEQIPVLFDVSALGRVWSQEQDQEEWNNNPFMINTMWSQEQDQEEWNNSEE